MSIKETLEPTSGVTLFVSKSVKESNLKRAATFRQVELDKKEDYTVSKRSKPFTKLATDAQSPRMTREDYFKIAESQGLVTMREEMGSLMNTKDNEILLQTGSVFASSKGGASFQIGMPSKKMAASNLISISANPYESSEDMDISKSRQNFKRRH